jgi:glycosyltransferase involved in cell wall biosynthesis
VTVGHLSNLTLEKGLDEVIRFGRTAIKQSKVARVILAGPSFGKAERALLDAVASEPGFEYRGPVSGRLKEDFFRDIDLFLFPTHYRHESFGLVVWEAMLRGVPVIAYRAGCLTQTAAGAGNLVLEPGEDFTTLGIRRIDQWSRSPAEFNGAMAAAIAVARREREQAISDVLRLGAELFAPPPGDATPTMAL